MKNATELVFILDKSGSMHGLEPDTTGAEQRGQEQALSAEQNVLKALDHLGGILHRRLKRGNVAGIHAKQLARREVYGLHTAVNLTEHRAAAGVFLQNKAFSAKQTALDAAVKIRGQLYAVLRAQERALLRDNFIIRLNVEFQNLARHGRRKGHLIDIAGRGKRRHEQRFTGKHSAERLAEAAL